MNNQLNRRLHAALNQAGMMPHKADLVATFTQGRSESSKDLTDLEARELIRHLSAERIARSKKSWAKVYHYCELMGMSDGKGNADKDRVAAFVRELSTNEKSQSLYQLDYGTLNKVVTQIEAIYKRTLTDG